MLQHADQSTCAHLCKELGLRVQREMEGAVPNHLAEPAGCISLSLTIQL